MRTRGGRLRRSPFSLRPVPTRHVPGLWSASRHVRHVVDVLRFGAEGSGLSARTLRSACRVGTRTPCPGCAYTTISPALGLIALHLGHAQVARGVARLSTPYSEAGQIDLFDIVQRNATRSATILVAFATGRAPCMRAKDGPGIGRCSFVGQMLTFVTSREAFVACPQEVEGSWHQYGLVRHPVLVPARRLAAPVSKALFPPELGTAWAWLPRPGPLSLSRTPKPWSGVSRPAITGYNFLILKWRRSTYRSKSWRNGEMW